MLSPAFRRLTQTQGVGESGRVAGNATITTVLTVTVPATALTDQPTPAADETPATRQRSRPTTRLRTSSSAVEEGAPAAPAPTSSQPTTKRRRAAPRPGRLSREGCTDRRRDEQPTGEGGLVRLTGPGAGEPVLVSRRWLAQSADTASEVQVSPCHPVTGALLDHLSPSGRSPNADGIHPVGAVVAPAAGSVRRLRPRQGHGETDPGPRPALPVPRLQHRRRVLRPRPRPTLARRTHPRQQPALPVPTPPPRQTTTRLDVTLTPDGVATWTDPTGRARTTHPVDALHHTVLTAPTNTQTPHRSRRNARNASSDWTRRNRRSSRARTAGGSRHQPTQHGTAAPAPSSPTAPHRARVPPRTPRRTPTRPTTHTTTDLARRPRPRHRSTSSPPRDHHRRPHTWPGGRAQPRRRRSHDDDPPPF